MYLSLQERAMLENTLYNLTYDMDCIGEDVWTDISGLSDQDLETVINDYLSNL